MTRREARETAFQLIYERSFQNDKTTSAIIKDTSAAQEFIPNKYIRTVLRGTEEKHEELDALINDTSAEWRIERMSAVSLSILRLAVYEMLYLEDMPFKVAINEAVELAKKFDHEKAPAFINGILNKIAVIKGLKTLKNPEDTGAAQKAAEAENKTEAVDAATENTVTDKEKASE